MTALQVDGAKLGDIEEHVRFIHGVLAGLFNSFDTAPQGQCLLTPEAQRDAINCTFTHAMEARALFANITL